MDKSILKERFEYIIGFLALVISLNGFKDELKAVTVNVVLFQFTLANYFFILILSLIAILHLYFMPFFIRSEKRLFVLLRKGFVYAVNFCLFLVVISPLVLLLMYGIAKLTPVVLNESVIRVLQIIVILIASGVTGRYAFKMGEFLGSSFRNSFSNMSSEDRKQFLKDLEEEERRSKGVF